MIDSIIMSQRYRGVVYYNAIILCLLLEFYYQVALVRNNLCQYYVTSSRFEFVEYNYSNIAISV